MLLTAGYLAGMLTHCDPKKAPKLEDIIGPEPGAAKPDQPAETEDPQATARANAKAWIAFMDGMNGARAKRRKAEDG